MFPLACSNTVHFGELLTLVTLVSAWLTTYAGAISFITSCPRIDSRAYVAVTKGGEMLSQDSWRCVRGGGGVFFTSVGASYSRVKCPRGQLTPGGGHFLRDRATDNFYAVQIDSHTTAFLQNCRCLFSHGAAASPYTSLSRTRSS